MLNARAQDDAGDDAGQQSSETPATSVDEQLEARHDGYTMVEPARPDLKPGESVTYVPDRYCVKCQQPRGIRKCSICGSPTVLRSDLGEVQLP
ncbi:MAG TPA: hypothetical protein VJN18_11010, partial [Polyangiaceae bacterium]|nr:hypothetical protein [Polyangiaceae bacterium]